MPTYDDAVRIAETWDGNGEPPVWDRHPATNRYRPGGNPDLERIGHPIDS
jgi:hypothetical protein